MKQTIFIVLSIILAKSLVYCTRNSEAEEGSNSYVKWLVNKINEECPLNMDEVGELTRVEFDNDKKTIDYVTSVYGDVFESLKKDIDYKDIIKISKIKMATKMFSHRDLMKAAVDERVSLNLVFENKENSEKIEVIMSPDDILDLLVLYPKEQDAYLALLKLNCSNEQKKCPGAWEDGTRLVSTEIVNKDGNYYINYDYEINEEVYQLFLIDEFKKEVEKETDNNVNRIVNSGDGILIMGRAECGYRYNYFSKRHNKNFVFEYPISKMKKMLTDPELRMYLK